jgi:hypothetical protein
MCRPGARHETSKLNQGSAGIGGCCPRDEAKAIRRMVEAGAMTEMEAVELIAVPEPIQGRLRAFCDVSGPADAAIVRRAVTFRDLVLSEFLRGE